MLIAGGVHSPMNQAVVTVVLQWESLGPALWTLATECWGDGAGGGWSLGAAPLDWDHPRGESGLGKPGRAARRLKLVVTGCMDLFMYDISKNGREVLKPDQGS